MKKLEVKTAPVNEKCYRVIEPCPSGFKETVYFPMFHKKVRMPVFIGSESCKHCAFFGGYVQSDSEKVMYINCKNETIWQKLKSRLKSLAEWLGL